MKALSIVRNTIFLGVLVSGLAHAEGNKTAYIHFEKAINEVDEGVKIKAELEKEMVQKKTMLEKKQKELIELDDSLKKQAAVLSPESRQTKIADLQKKAQEFQQLVATTEQNFMKRKEEAMAPLVQKMKAIGDAMRVEKNYDAIAEGSSLISVKAELDWTSDAVRRYNQTYTKGGKSGSAKK